MPNRVKPGSLLRELRVNVGQLTQNLQTLKSAGCAAIDISADAYGIGADFLLGLANDAQLGVTYDGTGEFESLYGFDGKTQVVQLVGEVVRTKFAKAGSAVSYGYIHRFERDTNLALVALGFCDGIPRAASADFQASVNGKRYAGVGRIAMDQVVLDTGRDLLKPGQEVEFFSEAFGIREWAKAAGLTCQEILLHIGPRVERVYQR